KPSRATPSGELIEVARYNGHSHWQHLNALEREEADRSSGVSPSRLSNSSPGGIFRPRFSAKTFSLLQCPSDPSQGSYPDAGTGSVYLTRNQSWGSTNYLANWHAFANNNPQSGYRTPPQNMATITDGLANTILFSEGYAWCDGKGRLAFNSWDYHSFGI